MTAVIVGGDLDGVRVKKKRRGNPRDKNCLSDRPHDRLSEEERGSGDSVHPGCDAGMEDDPTPTTTTAARRDRYRQREQTD